MTRNVAQQPSPVTEPRYRYESTSYSSTISESDYKLLNEKEVYHQTLLMAVFTLIPISEAPVTFRWVKIVQQDRRGQLLQSVKRLERRTFPTNEILNVDVELRKQNTTLCCILDEVSEVAAYFLYSRVGRMALLHKICVHTERRRKGIGSSMMSVLREELTKGKCDAICLWVDEDREAAKCLYAAHGFEETLKVNDYYGSGRTGVKMILHLKPNSYSL